MYSISVSWFVKLNFFRILAAFRLYVDIVATKSTPEAILYCSRGHKTIPQGSVAPTRVLPARSALKLEKSTYLQCLPEKLKSTSRLRPGTIEIKFSTLFRIFFCNVWCKITLHTHWPKSSSIEASCINFYWTSPRFYWTSSRILLDVH